MFTKEFSIPGMTPFRAIFLVGFGILFVNATAFPDKSQGELRLYEEPDQGPRSRYKKVAEYNEETGQVEMTPTISPVAKT